MKYIFTFFFFILSVSTSLGQCNQLTKAVKSAEKYFDDGNLEEASSQLISILKQEGVPYCPIERRKVQLLLTEISLFMNQDSIADIAYKAALEISPRYKVDTTLKSIDLYYFSQGYRTIPLFSIRPYLGINNYDFNNFDYFPVPDAANRYNVSIDDTSANLRTTDLGYNVGLQASWHPITFLEVSLGVAYSIKNIDIEKFIGVKTLSLRENQNWISIPVLARINLAHQDVIPKIITGIEYSYLVNATLSETANGNIISNNDKVNINSLRNRYHYAYVLGIGSDFRFSRINRNYFSIEIKYSNQRTALVNAGNRYNNPVTLFGLGYVDDDIPIGTHHLELSIGLSITKYQVQKIKR